MKMMCGVKMVPLLVLALVVQASQAFVVVPSTVNILLTLYPSLDCTGTATTAQVVPQPEPCLSISFNDNENPASERILINGVIVPNITSGRFECPNGRFIFGVKRFGEALCDTASVPLSSLCVFVISQGISAKVQCVQDVCSPSFGLPKQQCDNRIGVCDAINVPMKWTGIGCKTRNGRPRGDGGCQCKGYCGYKCRQACRRDPECFWNNRARKCNSKATGLPGLPIEECPFSLIASERGSTKGKSAQGEKHALDFLTKLPATKSGEEVKDKADHVADTPGNEIESGNDEQ